MRVVALGFGGAVVAFAVLYVVALFAEQWCGATNPVTRACGAVWFYWFLAVVPVVLVGFVVGAFWGWLTQPERKKGGDTA